MTATAMDRAVEAASLGHRKNTTPEERAGLERVVCSDPDARVRSAALGALVQIATGTRSGARRQAGATWRIAARDPDATVRRRAAELAPAAALYEKTTGRFLEVWTTEPGIQFYCGNFLTDKVPGKRGKNLCRRGGLAHPFSCAAAQPTGRSR